MFKHLKITSPVFRVTRNGLEEEESAYHILVYCKSFEGERGNTCPPDPWPAHSRMLDSPVAVVDSAVAVIGIKEEGDRVRATGESKPHQIVALERVVLGGYSVYPCIVVKISYST